MFVNLGLVGFGEIEVAVLFVHQLHDYTLICCAETYHRKTKAKVSSLFQYNQVLLSLLSYMNLFKTATKLDTFLHDRKGGGNGYELINLGS